VLNIKKGWAKGGQPKFGGGVLKGRQFPVLGGGGGDE